jgi:mannosyl-3-phosphoglycerate phosphatase
MKNYLVFTDLDGTLLNHDDYSFHDALESIKELQKRSIPIIIITSKTFAEVVDLQKEIGILHPFIVENGAGTFIPKDCPLASTVIYKEEWTKVSSAHSYIELRLFFTNLKRSYPLRGFGDMSVEEVMDLTGLDKENASKAMQRDFTEPFIIEDESLIEEIKTLANIEGLDIVKGGRFYHLISKNQAKENAMFQLTHMYDEYHGLKHTTVALGDSANDFEMIKAADIGILIQGHDLKYAHIGDENIKKSKFPGPKGWHTCISEILSC